MRKRRVWFLWSLAGLMAADELMFITVGFFRFDPNPELAKLWVLPIALCITCAPYLFVALLSAEFSRRYSVALWILTVGRLIVAELSLFYRCGEFGLAEIAWRARLEGQRYMNCAPPARFVILFLDYVGTFFVGLLATVVSFAQWIIDLLRTPSPPSPPPFPGRNSRC